MSAEHSEPKPIADDEDGWFKVITVFPPSLSTVAYRYESGSWFLPDPDFNEASLVGAHLERLIPESQIGDYR